MDTELCISHISEASSRLWSVYSPDTAALPVPACPAWTLRDLVLHLADVHHYWALNIHAADPSRQIPFEASYPEGADVLAWARTCLEEMIDAFRSVPADSPCRVWWVAPATAGAVAEHQVYEAELHRWDAQGAVMTPQALDLDICLVGIPEWIASRVTWLTELPLPLITFETTDAPSSASLGDATLGTVTVSGTASDVYLFMNGRVSADALEIVGDAELLEAFTSRMEYLNG
jgi:uncharacterized protein (TIGR03083 family)